MRIVPVTDRLPVKNRSDVPQADSAQPAAVRSSSSTCRCSRVPIRFSVYVAALDRGPLQVALALDPDGSAVDTGCWLSQGRRRPCRSRV